MSRRGEFASWFSKLSDDLEISRVTTGDNDVGTFLSGITSGTSVSVDINVACEAAQIFKPVVPLNVVNFDVVGESAAPSRNDSLWSRSRCIKISEDVVPLKVAVVSPVSLFKANACGVLSDVFADVIIWESA